MTIFGYQTVDELKILLEENDGIIKSYTDAIQSIGQRWAQEDNAAYADWVKDFNALKARYKAARDRATIKIALEGGSGSYTSADSEFLQVLQSFHQATQDTHGNVGQTQKGDSSDLDARLTEAGAAIQRTPVDPNKYGDADLAYIKATDKAGKTAKNWLKTAGLIVGGALALLLGIKITK
jgi:hypothetical protein